MIKLKYQRKWFLKKKKEKKTVRESKNRLEKWKSRTMRREKREIREMIEHGIRTFEPVDLLLQLLHGSLSELGTSFSLS